MVVKQSYVYLCEDMADSYYPCFQTGIFHMYFPIRSNIFKKYNKNVMYVDPVSYNNEKKFNWTEIKKKKSKLLLV